MTFNPDLQTSDDAEAATEMASGQQPYRIGDGADPAPGSDSWRLLQALMDQQRLEEAGETIRQLLNHYPEQSHLWIQWGNLLWRQQRMGDAELAYRRALSIDPRSSAACWCLVLLYRHAGRLEEAQTWFSRALQFNSGWFEARVGGLERIPGL